MFLITCFKLSLKLQFFF